MKRIYPTIPCIVSIVATFVMTVGCQLLTVNSPYAQVQSAAFDPNCYQPVIGMPGVVDTIYGSLASQSLGARIKNMGQFPGESSGRILIGEGFNSLSNPIYSSSPYFDLHQLHASDTFQLPVHTVIEPDFIVKRTHYRSKQYSDILLVDPNAISTPPRIYWADDEGRYDTSHYTDLLSPITGEFGIEYNGTNIYSAHLSSDSLDDIVYGIIKDDTISTNRTLYLLYFKGGNPLFGKSIAVYADSTVLLDTLHSPLENRMFSQGDYRGTGREDLIGTTVGKDVLLYKNAKPFSLTQLTYSLKYDTLMARWQNPNGGSNFYANMFCMRAFRKDIGDSSVDLMPTINNQIYIFKGGPEFGSHRIFKDSADFIIHHPSYYDSRWVSIGFGTAHDCGDMTGTGNRVLFVRGDGHAGLFGYFFFYVLGDAMDDKVDMYFEMVGHGFPGELDTVVADGDKLQDVIIGLPEYRSEEDFNLGKELVGSVWVVRGSTNIPAKRSSVTDRGRSTADISLFPNPVTEGHATLDISAIEPQDLNISVFNLLGNMVYADHIRSQEGTPTGPLSLSSLPNGIYMLEISGKNFAKRIQFTVLK
jgi:hypothetical protein